MVWLILALIAALFEAFAVQKQNHKWELFAKPAVMILLLVWLYTSIGFQGEALWFGLGLLFSLIGDVLLLNSTDQMFVWGVFAFLLTHVFYLIGFQNELLHFTAWSFVLLFFIYINGLRLLRRIVGSMRVKAFDRLIAPVIVYGVVISLMLYAAMSTIFDPAWKTRAALLVSVGAFLFYLSDLILAWNKFVSPLRIRRIPSILAYHLGQIGLIAGVINHFMSL
jgi:uncharacterized membrane protein YhhN